MKPSFTWSAAPTSKEQTGALTKQEFKQFYDGEFTTLKNDETALGQQVQNIQAKVNQVKEIYTYTKTIRHNPVSGWNTATFTFENAKDGLYMTEITTPNDINGLGNKNIVRSGNNVTITVGVNGKNSNQITLNCLLMVIGE